MNSHADLDEFSCEADLNLTWENTPIKIEMSENCIYIQGNHDQTLLNSYSKIEENHRIWRERTVQNLANNEDEIERGDNDLEANLLLARNRMRTLEAERAKKEEELKQALVEANLLNYELKALELEVNNISTRAEDYFFFSVIFE